MQVIALAQKPSVRQKLAHQTKTVGQMPTAIGADSGNNCSTGSEKADSLNSLSF
jgi:hypothetical protein